jgi:hypothetical protein
MLLQMHVVGRAYGKGNCSSICLVLSASLINNFTTHLVPLSLDNTYTKSEESERPYDSSHILSGLFAKCMFIHSSGNKARFLATVSLLKLDEERDHEYIENSTSLFVT